jgi:deoxyribonuclease IV
MSIKFGPAGLGGIKEAVSNLEKYNQLGLRACEIAFTYGVYLKKDDAIEIGKIAKKLGISLSIHAPYYINLNSDEKRKIEASRKRILECCEIAHYLGAGRVIFHPGFYGKDREEAYENIQQRIIEMKEEIEKNKWDVELCPEIMGKKNVFGSIEEISKLSEEIGCGFCIDFAHILARYNNYNFDLVRERFPQKKWHCHFSGIEYGEKGEKNHKRTSKEEWKKVLEGIPPDRAVVIINESPFPVEDSVEGLNLY